MAPRPLVLLVTAMTLLGSCRRAARLDDVSKMTYGAKPAVVRISAYATADFRYPAAAVDAAAKQMAEGQDPVDPRNVPAAEGVIQTGAGGSGSGFVIHPDGFILTSGHVVAATRDRAALESDLRRNGAIAALVKHFAVDELRALHRAGRLEAPIATIAAAGRLVNMKVVNSVELSNGDALPFAVKVYSPDLSQRGTDLALLKIERSNLPVLHLGDSEGVRVGDSIWSIGYPAVASSSDDVIGGWLSRDSDLEPTCNPGNITAIKRNVANTPVLQSNVAIYRGNSGGPAVDRNGDVIGISTWGHSDAEIKFLVPINIAKELVSKARVPLNMDGEFSRNYRAALDAAATGRWPASREDLQKASAYFPNSPDVIRFRLDVDRAMKSMPIWTLHPVATGTTAAAVLVALAFGLFSGARRSRAPKDVLTANTVESFVAPGGREAAPAVNSQMLGKFTILNGTRAGERLGLGGSGIRIGREQAFCEIVLDNPKVSRLHAEVVAIDGKVLLIDRNSSNGTFVNDQKIEKRYLKDGDIIYFGGRNAVAVAFHA